MTAQDAKAKLLAVIKELQDAGLSVGGHWDDDIVLLISRDDLPIESESWAPEDYAEISYDDVIAL